MSLLCLPPQPGTGLSFSICDPWWSFPVSRPSRCRISSPHSVCLSLPVFSCPASWWSLHCLAASACGTFPNCPLCLQRPDLSRLLCSLLSPSRLCQNVTSSMKPTLVALVSGLTCSSPASSSHYQAPSQGLHCFLVTAASPSKALYNFLSCYDEGLRLPPTPSPSGTVKSGAGISVVWVPRREQCLARRKPSMNICCLQQQGCLPH